MGEKEINTKLFNEKKNIFCLQFVFGHVTVKPFQRLYVLKKTPITTGEKL